MATTAKAMESKQEIKVLYNNNLRFPKKQI